MGYPGHVAAAGLEPILDKLREMEMDSFSVNRNARLPSRDMGGRESP